MKIRKLFACLAIAFAFVFAPILTACGTTTNKGGEDQGENPGLSTPGTNPGTDPGTTPPVILSIEEAIAKMAAPDANFVFIETSTWVAHPWNIDTHSMDYSISATITNTGTKAVLGNVARYIDAGVSDNEDVYESYSQAGWFIQLGGRWYFGQEEFDGREDFENPADYFLGATWEKDGDIYTCTEILSPEDIRDWAKMVVTATMTSGGFTAVIAYFDPEGTELETSRMTMTLTWGNAAEFMNDKPQWLTNMIAGTWAPPTDEELIAGAWKKTGGIGGDRGGITFNDDGTCLIDINGFYTGAATYRLEVRKTPYYGGFLYEMIDFYDLDGELLAAAAYGLYGGSNQDGIYSCSYFSLWLSDDEGRFDTAGTRSYSFARPTSGTNPGPEPEPTPDPIPAPIPEGPEAPEIEE
jgi:hypothetical protein